MSLNKFINLNTNPIDHLAIFQEPYLSLIFSHKKTIESRWSLNRIAPFQKIKENDRILLKLTGKPIYGEAYVDKCLFFDHLTPSEIKKIMMDYKQELQINDAYYELKKDSRFVSLIWLKNIVKYHHPISIQKRNQLSWIANFKLKEMEAENP